jgi:hypothetical protein
MFLEYAFGRCLLGMLLKDTFLRMLLEDVLGGYFFRGCSWGIFFKDALRGCFKRILLCRMFLEDFWEDAFEGYFSG